MGKTTGVLKLQLSLWTGMYTGEATRQQPWAHCLRHRRRQYTEATTSSSLSLSLSLSAALFTLSKKNRKWATHSKTVCPKSYLYTYDFRAIYKYSLKGPWQTYSQICPRIRISLRVHSSSGSVTGVFSIRLRNRGLHHPDPYPGTLHPASCRVLFIIRFRNRNRACRHSSPDIPSGGTEIPTLTSSLSGILRSPVLLVLIAQVSLKSLVN